MNSENDANKSERVSEEPAAYGAKVRLTLVPDGLPWPKGYFDCKLRVTLEDAIARSGVRPSMYRLGRPVYSEVDCANPNYRFPYSAEPEWYAELLAEADRRDAEESK